MARDLLTAPPGKPLKLISERPKVASSAATARSQPSTIAMVNGYCFGGAFAIVEGCDLAIAAEEATFGLSEINFKGFPGGAVSKSLANLLRPRDALLYAMTGRRFDGKTAASIGLVILPSLPRSCATRR